MLTTSTNSSTNRKMASVTTMPPTQMLPSMPTFNLRPHKMPPLFPSQLPKWPPSCTRCKPCSSQLSPLPLLPQQQITPLTKSDSRNRTVTLRTTKTKLTTKSHSANPPARSPRSRSPSRFPVDLRPSASARTAKIF